MGHAEGSELDWARDAFKALKAAQLWSLALVFCEGRIIFDRDTPPTEEGHLAAEHDAAEEAIVAGVREPISCLPGRRRDTGDAGAHGRRSFGLPRLRTFFAAPSGSPAPGRDSPRTGASARGRYAPTSRPAAAFNSPSWTGGPTARAGRSARDASRRLKRANRWPLLLVENRKRVLDRHKPAGDSSRVPEGTPPAMTLSSVIGRSRTRLPVAWKTALAIAAATPTMPISPSPLTPSGLTTRRAPRRRSPRCRHVGVHRHVVLGEVVVHEPAEAVVEHRSSSSAMPMPQTTPPRTWLRAVFGLMIRPRGDRRRPRGDADRAEVLVDPHLREDRRVRERASIPAASNGSESASASRTRRALGLRAAPPRASAGEVQPPRRGSRALASAALSATAAGAASRTPPGPPSRPDAAVQEPASTAALRQRRVAELERHVAPVGSPSVSAAIWVMIV